MKIINDGLSPALFSAVIKVNDKYSKGGADYSVTELIDSPRILILKKQYYHELVENASDMLWRFFGHIVHMILAQMDNRNVLSEERLFMSIPMEQEVVVISGCPDRFDADGVLTDYKFTSKYSVKEGIKPEWEAQLNLYRRLLYMNYFSVEKLLLEAILRDASKARKEKGVVVLEAPMWTEEKALSYIKERIRLHREAEKELPLCSKGERWYKGESWAVKKGKNKNAIRNGVFWCDDFEDEGKARGLAERLAEDLGEPHWVDCRAGKSNRCEEYCIVSGFCTQWKEEENAKSE